MRALFLLLLLANVLFLAWTRWVVPPPSATASAAVTRGPALQPIRLRAEPAPAGKDSPLATTDSGLQSVTCVSVGPFIDPVHADAARAQLERLGFSSRRRVSQDEVRVGYWVRVPGLATPADATNALATLQAAGLGDAYVVDEGEDAGTTLSIGVYADAVKAAQVAKQVQDAGFTPETSDRLRTLEVLWLDVDRQGNGSLPAVEALGEPPPGALPYDMRACPATSAADAATPAATSATEARPTG